MSEIEIEEIDLVNIGALECPLCRLKSQRIKELLKQVEELKKGIKYSTKELEASGLCFDHPTIKKLNKLLKEEKE